jgi:tetratricopeptide (TPR) repeat protein
VLFPVATVAPVSPRARVYAVVAVSAALAAAVAVGGAIATRTHRAGSPSLVKPREGHPRLELDLGVREDALARTLRRAQNVYDRKRYDDARALVADEPGLEARVVRLFAEWPGSSLPSLEELAVAHPRDSFLDLHLGLARYWAGQNAAAVTAWRDADRAQPDTMSAIRAEDLLHPDFFPGRPTFVPSFGFPARIAGLSPPAQLRALRTDARGGDVRAKILYGVALQRLGKSLSAQRQYEAAARMAPRDPEPRVAAAVARFDKDDLAASFSRLGPLARRYPHAPTVRFHLGLMLLWIGRPTEARRQLALAVNEGPRSPLGREAKRFLERLAAGGTG